MRLYNLPILKLSPRIQHLVSAQRRSPQSLRVQAAAVKGNVYYNCIVISQSAFYLRRVDFKTGKRDDRRVEIRKFKLSQIFLCQQWLVLAFKSKDIGYIQVEKIFEKSQLFSMLMQKEDFACFCSIQDMFLLQLSPFRILSVEKDIIAVFLKGNSLFFKKVAQNCSKTFSISTLDLGYNEKDRIISFQINQQNLFNHNCQNQLILVVVQICQENGEQIYILIELLWLQSKYTSYAICAKGPQKQNRTNTMRISTFAQLYILIYIGKQLVICKRWQQGVHTFGILSTEMIVEDLIAIQNVSKRQQLILMVGQVANKKLVYSYNFSQLLTKMVFLPKMICCDEDLSGRIFGFINLPQSLPLLVVHNQTYILVPVILKLYYIITNVYSQEQDDQGQQFEAQIFEQTKKTKSIQFMLFSSFRAELATQKQIHQAMDELFSPKRINSAIQDVQSQLSKSIFCLQDDSSLCLNSLLREYTYVFLYLLNFLASIKQQNATNKAQILIDQSSLLQQSKMAFDKLYFQTRLMEETAVETQIHSKMISLRDNLFGILNLFAKSLPKSAQNSIYCYFQILKQLSQGEIVEFLTNKTSLIDYLSFFIYKASVEGNHVSWKLGRSLLQKLLQIRQDYPPLIGLLCGDATIYSTSYHHLDVCKFLRERQQADLKQFQNLPSLISANVSVPKYLKQIGYECLLIFVPDDYQAQKYDGDFMVLNIPKKWADFAFGLLREQTLQIRQNVYLMLTQQNIVKGIQSMGSHINIELLAHSRSQILILSQRLKIINEIFVRELVRCFSQKTRKRQNKQQQMKYDCRCFSNQQYEKIITARRFQARQDRENQNREVDEHPQLQIIQDFYLCLLEICQKANLCKLAGFLQTAILKQNPSVMEPHLQSLEISKIKINKTSQRLEPIPQHKDRDKFYEIVFINLWDLHERLVHASEKQFIQFEEQLHYSCFYRSFSQILCFVSAAVQRIYIQHIEQLYQSSQVLTITFERIRKAVLQKHKISLKNKCSETLSYFQQTALINIVRTQLIWKNQSLAQYWVCRFEDLIVQCALNQASLSFKSQTILSALIQLKKN